MNQYLGFDPLIYLGIKDKSPQLATQIMEQLSIYLIARTTQNLSDEQIEKIDSTEELFKIAKNNDPQFESHIKQYLTEFKYQLS